MRDGSTYGSPMAGLTQNVAYTGTAGTIANVVPPNCVAVRLVSTTDCFVRIGNNPTATTADMYLVAGVPETFGIGLNDKVSAVQVSSGGTIYVTPLV